MGGHAVGARIGTTRAFDKSDRRPSARYAALAEPEAVVARVLRGEMLSLRFREWLDTRSTPKPGDPDRTADRVAALDDERDAARPWLLVFEFQSRHEDDKLDVTLTEGKNREVRRMIETVGFKALKLVRTRIGALTLENLEVGKYRRVTASEVAALKEYRRSDLRLTIDGG